MRSPSDTPDLLGAADISAPTQAKTAIELAVVSRDGELRILDTDLAARLGFERPRKIRELIAPHRRALSQLGELATADVVVGKGQRATAYYLNKRQAIFLTAKSETVEATAITLEIIERFDAYEHGAIRAPAPLPARRGVTAREAASTFRAYRGIAKLVGLDENQAALSAARATKLDTGIDPLAQMGITHLLAPQQELLLTPSDIGVRLGGKSAIAVNQLLAERGFQVGRRDGKGQPYWEPTAAGEPHATLLDTGKRHGNGTPIRQLKWGAGIIDLLTEGTVQ
ncbi:hypothetical protein BKE38_04020 [Pseudoroseomonas deserti]|uniref:Antirepressor protein C-terminal domain-containing protein n=1 Tax=Teichococcus deserti TaxID=1817963 RepID=A0A1V2H6E5_9PROT|nr:hypothetical protein [Pseudoroseomonas deserti]ONG57326.1 hypothetical protein BKE38_04020 [Pseudoroseomonas deserti]